MGGCMPFYSYEEMIASGLFEDYPLFITAPFDPLFVGEHYDPSTGSLPLKLIEEKLTELDFMPPRVRLDLFQVYYGPNAGYVLVDRIRQIVIGQKKHKYKGIRNMTKSIGV